MTYFKSREKGQVLIIAIIFMAVILIFSTTIFTKVSGFINFGSKSVEKQQAIHIAEAGIDLALKKITDNPAYNPDPNEKNPIGSPPTGEFTVKLDTITPAKKTITVEAFVPNAASPKTRQKAQITLNATGDSVNFPSAADSEVIGGCGHVHNDALITNNNIYVVGKNRPPPTCSFFPNYQFQKQSINLATYQLNGDFLPTGLKYTLTSSSTYPVVPSQAAVISGLINGFMYSLGAVDSSPALTGNSKVYFNTDPGTNYWTQVESLPDESTGNPALAGGTTGGLLSRRNFAAVFTPVNQADADGLIVLIGGALGFCPDINNPCQRLSTMLVAEKNPGLGTLHPTGFENKGDINLGHPAWPKWWNSAAAANNDKVYILGGTDTDLVIYSTVTGGVAGGDVGPFTENPNKLPKKISHSSAVVANSYLFLLGGRENYTDGSGNPAERIIKDVYSAKINADGSLDPFVKQKNLVLVAEDAGAAVLNNNIYFTGGHTDRTQNINSPIGYSDVDYLRSCWRTVANADGTINDWKDCNSDETYTSGGGGSGWAVDKSTYHLK